MDYYLSGKKVWSVLKTLITKLSTGFQHPAYNFGIHTQVIIEICIKMGRDSNGSLGTLTSYSPQLTQSAL